MTDYDLLLAEEEFIADAQMYLLNLMGKQGISKADLARKLGISKSAVSQMFGNEPTNFSMRKFARIAAVLGAKVSVSPQADVDAQRRLEIEAPRFIQKHHTDWHMIDLGEFSHRPANENHPLAVDSSPVTELDFNLWDSPKKYRAVRQYA